ncbi:helix-turn-helix domain-containing protein [Kribbella sp. CA-293567]|uniref:helix-turn-helix domain-containing protein n=1 Tax=Kribbella sp. CA-293567 TaxID=3002436 RepID=UPI0022DD507C|nr:helix-turn-helix domain-containing protein [Kribbella sp. CA-293567]WBQ02566.1 helix-turn-helix domain-containing protein [Kribbella sp. CA-293567]
MEGFEHHVRRPHPALRRCLGDLTGYAYYGEPLGLHRGLPSQYLTIVISLDEPLGIAWPDSPVEKFQTVVSGLHSTAVRIGDSANSAGIQLALTPEGSRALLGQPSGELASLMLDVDTLLGVSAQEVGERLRATPHWHERFDLVERLLLEAWRDEPIGAPRAELSWAWRRLRETAGGVGVQELAREVGWSRRHLTERFRAEYGLTPKVAARVLRFERAVAQLKARPRTRLADLAADLGYADQAHLTREWHAIAGCSPRQWMTEELPFVQDDRRTAVAGSGV